MATLEIEQNKRHKPIIAKLFDSGSDHTFSECGFWTFSGHRRPQLITYSKDYEKDLPISIFVDGFIFDRAVNFDNSKYKVAVILESRAIIPEIYKRLEKKISILERFDLVVCHDLELLQRAKNAFFVPVAGSWLTDQQIETPIAKSALISFIYSSKRTSRGHLLRHQVAEKLQGFSQVACLGTGSNKPIENKHSALAPYMFSVVILNENYPIYFTEALIDCFLTKTIPIFWGGSFAERLFDSRGIYVWKEIEELISIIESLTENDYIQKKEFVERNFHLAKQLVSFDDLLALTIVRFLKKQIMY